ncbi:hypothetical protein SAMD00019534_034230, partial [Acytostelium subglobosum LB1]|uniref:hypothetical protein n=1 Tax=Acytostelium subglobosum LB1 TaxID=1410327 RepID=UPI000644F971
QHNRSEMMRSTTLAIAVTLLIVMLSVATTIDGKMTLSQMRKNRGSGQQRVDAQGHQLSQLEYLKQTRAANPITQVRSTPQQFQVNSLPGLDPSVNITHYAGYLNVDQENNGNLFFWFIQANVSNPMDYPVLIWINGGPGCSSMDGLFIENGPFRVVSNNQSSSGYNVNINPSSWHNTANMLYIDEPVGTGFSYVLNANGYVRNDNDLEVDFYMFLQEFYKVFVDFHPLPLYMSGESYAGHYIPHYANYVLQMNTAIANQSLTNFSMINLAGLAIGNGWTHPVTQYDSYSKQAYGIGIISQDQYNAYKPLVSACQAQINRGIYNSNECNDVLGQLSDDSGTANTSQVNVYDYRLYESNSSPDWPPGCDDEALYLSDSKVRLAIHVDNATYSAPTEWSECNETSSQFLTNIDESSLHLFPYLLANLRVLVYNGQFDIICNHVGTQEYLSAMQWNGAAQWANQERSMWFAEKDGSLQTAGYFKGPVQNLTFMLVLGGSHMVPMDEPEFSFEMISKFVTNVAYNSLLQSNGTIPRTQKIITSPITETAWILIVVSGFIAGLIIGVVAVVLYVRSKESYTYTRI